LNPGDRVLMEEPHYTGARCAFQAAGAELVFSPVDDHGMRIPKPVPGKRACRLAYVSPSHQFPTGAVLSIERRLELLAWASRLGAFIVEDDYDGEYRYDGQPLQALGGFDRHGSTIYVGTFSKILFPALRLGYLVLPQSLVEPFVATKAVADTGTAALEQLALADFIDAGHFDRHLRRTTAANAARRKALVAALRQQFGDRVEICGGNAGLHVFAWLQGKNGGSIADASERAEKAGVGLYTADPFYAKPPDRTGFLLGFAGVRERDIREGIRQLARSLG
jgi:GntR family transcriptional regulator/MocR family aminotransferase